MRKNERDRDREREREKRRDRDREKERQREREIDKETEGWGEGQGDRETETERQEIRTAQHISNGMPQVKDLCCWWWWVPRPCPHKHRRYGLPWSWRAARTCGKRCSHMLCSDGDV